MRKDFFQTEKQQYVVPNINVIKMENEGHLLDNSKTNKNAQGGNEGELCDENGCY